MLPRLIGVMLALAVGAGSLGLGGCALVHPHFQQPTVRVVAVELRGGNFLQQNFAVKLNVQNPNDRDLPVRELRFALKVEGEEFASGSSEQAFTVPALGDVDFELGVSTNIAAAVLKLAGARQQHASALAYQLTGTARLSLPFTRKLSFHQDGSLPLADFFK